MKGELTTEARLRMVVTRLKHGTARLRVRIADLERAVREKDVRITELEGKLRDKEGQRKELLSFLYQPKKKTVNPVPRGKKKGAPAFHRPKPKPEEVTERRTYVVTVCPACAAPVGPAVDEVVKYEEDIVLVPKKTVKEYVISRHWCPQCETFVRSTGIPVISRIGPNTMAYILYARYRLRLPFAKIRESLTDLHNFTLSEGEIGDQLKAAKTLFDKDYGAISELVKTATVVHADETGWRMEGEHWWLWCFVVKDGIRYILEDTRGKGVAETALGDKQDRVLVSDGYAAYKNLAGEKQQCWVHLMRKAKLHVPALHEDLALLYHQLLLELEKPVPKRDMPYFIHQLDALAEKPYPEPEAKQTQARIQRDRDDLLTCLSHDGVLPENNTAERAIRTQVVMRKIFGGSRSVAGASTHAVNASVIETMRKRHPEQGFFGVFLPLIEKRRSGL